MKRIFKQTCMLFLALVLLTTSLPLSSYSINVEQKQQDACSTGAGGKGGKNLPTVAVEQGAKTAVGFEDNVDCDDANNWTIDFFNLIEDGMSVKAACDQLREGDYANTGLASPVICGYEYTRLN